jgi:glycerol-3-phosphate dehydrogenase
MEASFHFCPGIIQAQPAGRNIRSGSPDGGEGGAPVQDEDAFCGILAQRESQAMADFDLAIIGGGINGAGIARDAAGRGLKVVLVEQDDLASGTSSASTKLIHGGLRYLEHGWLRLVREALAERDVLMRMAPHLVRPLRLVLPVEEGRRSRLILRLGLFVYDHLGGRRFLPPTAAIDMQRDPVGGPLKHRPRYGYEYSDCQTDDARLVVLNALDAAERGAVIRTRTRCVAAVRSTDWRLTFESRGCREVASARVLVNATGPWVGLFGETVLGQGPARRLRLDKGSHIVVRRLFEHDRGYLLQNRDGRVVFALPYERDFTLVGTTDGSFAGDPAAVSPAPAEIDYLCDVVNAHFRTPLAPGDIVHAFAGVRALYDDGSSRPQDTPRDYVLAFDAPCGQAPLLTVYGGKITTYRRLAEAALDRLAPVLRVAGAWTATAHLPGGDIAVDGLEDLLTRTRRAWPFLAESQIRRLVQSYGTRVDRILGSATNAAALGPWFGELSAAEVRYLLQQEWAQTADDVLWRRTKLGLALAHDQRARLVHFLADRLGGSERAAIE